MAVEAEEGSVAAEEARLRRGCPRSQPTTTTASHFRRNVIVADHPAKEKEGSYSTKGFAPAFVVITLFSSSLSKGDAPDPDPIDDDDDASVIDIVSFVNKSFFRGNGATILALP